MSVSHESVITFQNQLASIMEVLVKNAVCEITKLFENRLGEIQSINVAQREMENCTSKHKPQQPSKIPGTGGEYNVNGTGGNDKTEFDAWDEHLSAGTINVFGHFVSNDNENVTKILTEKPSDDNPLVDREFDQRWSSDLWRDGEASSSGAGKTETQTIHIKQEITEETDVCCSACGKMPVFAGSLCSMCTGFSHQGAQIDSQPSSMLQPETLEIREPVRKRPYTMTEESGALSTHQLPSRYTQRHITIVRMGVFPALQQCRSCCRLVHCPFCKESVYKPKNMYHVKRHIQIHLKSGVHYGDYIICRCNLECRKGAHFHCLWCSKTILRKEDFLNHLTVCQEKSCPFTHLLNHHAPFPATSSYEYLQLPPPGGI